MSSVEDALAKVPLFSQFSRKDLERLAKGTVTHDYASGSVIVKEGDQALGFFLILSGRAEVVKDAESANPRVIGTLAAGDFFGEMALLDGYLRSASVRAVEATKCLMLSRWDFLAELRTSPNIALQMLSVLSRRLREVESTPPA
jgi:CRP/FNR family transcriptional regulator/CRP/FNR family cyclic AMP-dependent transcriptional regulator